MASILTQCHTALVSSPWVLLRSQQNWARTLPLAEKKDSIQLCNPTATTENKNSVYLEQLKLT